MSFSKLGSVLLIDAATAIAGIGIFAFVPIPKGAAMAVAEYFVLYLALMFLYGVPMTMIQTAAATMIQETTEENMQGRVFGLLGTMYAGFLPVGMALFGPLADVVPLQRIMVISGIALVMIAGVLYRNKLFIEN